MQVARDNTNSGPNDEPRKETVTQKENLMVLRSASNAADAAQGQADSGSDSSSLAGLGTLAEKLAIITWLLLRCAGLMIS